MRRFIRSLLRGTSPHSRFIAVLRLLALITLFVAPLQGHGTTAAAKQHEVMKNELNSRELDVREWASDEKQEVLLAFGMGALGLVIGTCQTTARPWSRVATVVLGLLVSIITLCTNTFYAADYQTLRRARHSARPMLEAMQNAVALYSSDMTAEDFRLTQTDFYHANDRFDTIADSVLGVSSARKQKLPAEGTATTFLAWKMQAVLAQSEANAPNWVSSDGQSDSLGTFAVGSYTDTSLEKAKTLSMDQALHRAAERYQHDHPEAAATSVQSQMLSLLTQFGTVTDTWITRNKGVYTYFTRLRVSNKVGAFALSAPSVNSSEETTGNCTWTKLGQERSLRFALSTSPLFVFLSKQHLGSRGDVSDLFVTESDPESMRDSVTEQLTALSRTHPESTKKLVLPSKTTTTVEIGGHTYSVTFQSHAFLHYGTVTVCRLR